MWPLCFVICSVSFFVFKLLLIVVSYNLKPKLSVLISSNSLLYISQSWEHMSTFLRRSHDLTTMITLKKRVFAAKVPTMLTTQLAYCVLQHYKSLMFVW